MSLRSFPWAVVDVGGTDDELVHACLKGDSGAWTELVSRYGGYVHAVATRAYRLPRESADDVFQDVWIRIYDGLTSYRGDGDLRAWIRSITLRACADHARRSKRHGLAEPLDRTEAVTAAVADLDAALDVRMAVSRLGDSCRATIELAFFDDLTQAETARRLGVPEGTVAARVSRCLRRLRDDLQANDGPEASGDSR